MYMYVYIFFGRGNREVIYEKLSIINSLLLQYQLNCIIRECRH